MSEKTIDTFDKDIVLTRLADEFAARFRAGERPTLQEYLDRYPHWADDIRELFPAMAEIERVKGEHPPVADRAADEPSPPLQRLGDFRVIREVGKGGMGIVYEAEQVSLGRHVALKVLPRNMLLDAKAKQRFEREAKAAAKLHHTNIVPVFGVGEQDGMPYYVMQFIQGLGLDAVLQELQKLQPGNVKTGTFRRGALTADNMARSLLTGSFQANADVEGQANESPDNAADKSAVDPGANRSSGAPADSRSLSSSSVVLPGAGHDGSKAKHRKPTYWQSVASIGVQVANALEYAHKQGIKHRDIKPSNLLLDTQGTVWVTDFGLAKADDQQNLTHTGDILGTLRYLAPEAFEGKTDGKSDVYSLGLTLYEMLAFRPAFDERERNRLIKQVTHAEPARLRKVNRNVPQDLETIVHKAIDKDPRQRYASAAALAEDLHRFIDDEPILARRASSTERLIRWGRRNPALAAASGFALAAATVVVAISIWFALYQQRTAAELREALQQSEISRRRAQEFACDAAVQRARTFNANSESGEALLWLARSLELAPAESTERQQEIRQMMAVRGSDLVPLDRQAEHRAAINQVALSPDGQLFVTTSDDKSACLWDKATLKKLQTFLGHQDAVLSAAFSPDGQMLATGSRDTTIKLWEVSSGRLLATLVGHTRGITRIVFSPDGKTVATISGSSFFGIPAEARLWEKTSGKPIGAPLQHQETMSKLVFMQDSKTLWTWGKDKTVRQWSATTGLAVDSPLSFPEVADWRSSVTFSPDGQWVLVGMRDGTANVWDLATRKAIGRPVAHGAPVLAVAFSADAKLFLTASSGSNKVWETMTGMERSVLTWLSGQDIMFYAKGQLRLHESSVGGEIVWDALGLQRVALGLIVSDPLSITTDRNSSIHYIERFLRGDRRFSFTDKTTLQGTPAQLILWAEVVTCKSLDKREQVVRLDEVAWLEKRRRLDEAIKESRLTGMVADAVKDPFLWLRRDAERCQWEGDWPGALKALGRLIEVEPTCQHLDWRGDAFTELGHHAKAVMDYKQAGELKESSGSLRDWYKIGVVALTAGDIRYYRAVCASAVESLLKGSNSELGGGLDVCLLSPEGIENAVQLLPRAAEEVKEHPTDFRRLVRYGIVLLRNQQPAAAIEQLMAVEKSGQDGPKTWLYLALAHQRLGQSNKARKWMERAVRLLDEEDRRQSLTLTEQLELRLLEREARALLGDGRGHH
jgi:serine/threonine protein kinase